MREGPDYHSIEIRKWRENAKDVTSRLGKREANLLKRIALFVRRFGFSRESVEEKIENDVMFAAHFAIEPRRQGIHEHAAAEWLEKLEGVENFVKLPKSGPLALYITSDGEVRKGMKRAPSKSLDFHWRVGKRHYFASHKYTFEGGGNQDSQFKEMKDLLEKFQKGSASPNIALLVIADGPYYTESKMAELRRFTRSSAPLSHALSIDQIPSVIERQL